MVARDITATIERAGGVKVRVLSRGVGSVDGFNNTEWEFDDDPDGDGEVTRALCARTYPNRSAESEANYGDRKQDNPVFMFPRDEWVDVAADARIAYPEPDGSETIYELQSPTKWPTHVEIFGSLVSN